MPDSSRRIRDVVANEENAIVSRVGFELVHSGAGREFPGVDGGLHSNCVSERCEREIGGAAYREVTVGDIVKHVALCRM